MRLFFRRLIMLRSLLSSHLRRLSTQREGVSVSKLQDHLEKELQALKGRVADLEAQLKRKKMVYRPLGKTGIDISVVSLGCASLGGVYGGMDESKAQAIVNLALENGINFFDTSPYYGNFESEKVLGKCLQNSGYPSSSFYVGTKVGRYVGEASDFSAKRVKESVLASLSRLRLDKVEIVQCHDIEFASSLDLVIQEALPALKELQREGKLKTIGITGLPLQVLDYVHEQCPGHVEIILSYCCQTLNNANLGLYLPRWAHQRLGVIQGGFTSMGLLTPQGPPAWHPAPEQIKEVCRKAVQHCEAKNKSIAELSFRFTLLEERLTSTLVGATEPAHLQQVLRWLQEGSIDHRLLEEVLEILAPIRNKIWVEQGSEEAIALAYGGYWAGSRTVGKVISGSSSNLG